MIARAGPRNATPTLFVHVVDEADAADGRRRQDAAPLRLVVERHVARHDREVERAGRLADALQAAHELAHDLGPLRIAEIEIIGERQRRRAGRRDVAPGFGDRLPAALHGVGLAIALRHVGGHGEALGPVADAHDGGVAARAAAPCCRG